MKSGRSSFSKTSAASIGKRFLGHPGFLIFESLFSINCTFLIIVSFSIVILISPCSDFYFSTTSIRFTMLEYMNKLINKWVNFRALHDSALVAAPCTLGYGSSHAVPRAVGAVRLTFEVSRFCAVTPDDRFFVAPMLLLCCRVVVYQLTFGAAGPPSTRRSSCTACIPFHLQYIELARIPLSLYLYTVAIVLLMCMIP